MHNNIKLTGLKEVSKNCEKISPFYVIKFLNVMM